MNCILSSKGKRMFISLILFRCTKHFILSRKNMPFWRIPVFTNYGFKLDRKKKKYYIPDAASERV